MSRSITRSSALAVLIAAGLGLAAPSDVVARDATRIERLGVDGMRTWIVLFDEPAVASFRGGKPSKDAPERFAATSPAATGAGRLDMNSAATRAYAAYLDDRRSERLLRAEVEFGRPLVPESSYTVALNGMALRLTPDEARRLAKMPGVRRVSPNWIAKPVTDAGPKWIKADTLWEGSAGPLSRGEGVVVGVIDTGVNASHPMFAASGAGFTISNPRGSFLGKCTGGGAPCNNKLIGVYDFTTGANSGETDNGLDVDGHGSHTASTAVGNPFIGSIQLGGGGSSVRTFSGVAPRANLITYKACEKEADCEGSWLLAAINQAVTDGVDVINYSIGGGALDPWSGDDALAMRNAYNAGIVVVVAAGNDGPVAGTINSPGNAPWVLTVAASTHTRAIRNDLLLSGGVPPLPGGGVLHGAGDTAGTTDLNLIFADVPLCGSGPDEDVPDVDGNVIGTSTPPSWTSQPFNAGQMVLCERGFYARVAKSNNVRVAGGGAMVLLNQPENGASIVADRHSVPSTHLTAADADALRQWVALGAGPKGRLKGAEVVDDPGVADIVADFSGRGPNPGDTVNIEDVLKPNISAPGVDILAAAGTGTGLAPLNGTSMATPHVAGSAALLIAARSSQLAAKGPARVDQIMAALSTSARPSIRDTDGVTPATPFDQGSGVAQLDRAVNAGLYFPIAAGVAGFQNFGSANPAIGGDPRKLNLPAFVDDDCFGSCRLTRRAVAWRNAGSWQVEVDAPAGVSVSASPSSFTLGVGQAQDIVLDVTITDPTLLGHWAFGSVRLVRSPADGVSDARLPLAIKASIGTVPAPIVRTVSGDAGFIDIPVSGMAAMPDLRFSGSALTAPVQTNVVLAQDPSTDDIYGLGVGETFRTISVPPGPGGAPANYQLRIDLASATAEDMDLFVGADFDGDGRPDEAEELCSSLTEVATEHCELDIQHPGGNGNLTYWWLVQNFTAGSSGSDTANVTVNLVARDPANTNLVVTGPGHVEQDAVYTMRVAWNDPSFKPGQTRRGFALIAPTVGNVVGQVPVILTRDSSPSVPRVLLDKVDLPISLAPGEALDRIFFDVPPNASAVTFSATGASGVDLYAAPAPARVDNRTTIDPAPARASAPLQAVNTQASKSLSLTGAALTPGRWYLTPVARAGVNTVQNIVLRAEVTQADPRPVLRAGHYFDAGRIGSSSGLFLDFAGNTWFAVWYAYLEDGSPTWYFGQGAAPDPNDATRSFRGDLLRVVWNGDAPSNVKVGEFSITPTGAESFDFSFMVDGKTGSEPMTRLGAGGCVSFAGSDLDVSGHWFSPSRTGFGYSTQIEAGSNQEIVASYLYDAQGFPRWLFGQVQPFAPGQPVPLRQASQGACPTCDFVATPPFEVWPVVGSLARTYVQNNITDIGVNATLVPPLAGTWQEALPVLSLSERKLCQ